MSVSEEVSSSGDSKTEEEAEKRSPKEREKDKDKEKDREEGELHFTPDTTCAGAGSVHLKTADHSAQLSTTQFSFCKSHLISTKLHKEITSTLVLVTQFNL